MKGSLLSMLLLSAVAVQASDDFDAAAYHQTQCTGCHDTRIYTRADRRVNSLARLDSQVRMCDANLGKKLFDDDITALVNYLNDNFYHFSH